MRIGFFDFDIQILSVFKDTIKNFPEFDYVVYIETQELVPKETSLRAAVHWLIEKQVHVIVTGEGAPDLITRETSLDENVVMLKVSELASYLEEIRDNKKEMRGTERVIHLTKHSDALDKTIAEILGGVFIAQ